MAGRGIIVGRRMHRRETVAFTHPVTGKTVYLAARTQWDGSWYTSDINRAKIRREPGVAAQDLRYLPEVARDMKGRVIDARTVKGYVDKPSRADREEGR